MFEFLKNFNDGTDNLALQVREFFNSPFMLELGEFIGKILAFSSVFLLLIFVILLIVFSIKNAIEEDKTSEEIKEVFKKTAKEIEETEKMAEKIKLLEDSPAYKTSKVKVVKK